MYVYVTSVNYMSRSRGVGVSGTPPSPLLPGQNFNERILSIVKPFPT